MGIDIRDIGLGLLGDVRDVELVGGGYVEYTSVPCEDCNFGCGGYVEGGGWNFCAEYLYLLHMMCNDAMGKKCIIY